jgi:hypothetical protein
MIHLEEEEVFKNFDASSHQSFFKRILFRKADVLEVPKKAEERSKILRVENAGDAQ